MPVVLQCNFDAAFTDQSPSAHTLTAFIGRTFISTAQKKYGAASALIDTSINSGSVSQSDANRTDWQFGAGQFTVECWVFFTAAPGSNLVGFVTQFGGSSNLGWFLGMVSGSLAFYYSTTGTNNLNIGVSWTPTLNTWYHIAADRDASNVMRLYRDGVVVASATVATALFNSTQAMIVGNDNNGNRGLPGYIDDVRVTKGTAQYAGAFTPPGPFTPGATARQYAVTVIG